MFEQRPSHIGRYELTGKIGSGAMGTVYKGLDPGIGRLVAIKLVRAELCHGRDGQDYLDRFRQEVRAAGRCNHPGIVAIFDCGEWEERPYLVMEYLQGKPLQHMIAEGPLQPERAVTFVMQLLEALGVVHQQGVVHRDIKPANIIVTADRRLKITDFGLALLDAEPLAKPESLVGTPSFMAPEQARGETVDHRADLFSVGIVLFRMLTGSSPYGNDTFATILEKVASPHRIDVSAVETASPLLASVVALALQKDVSDRFQSAAEFAHSLRSVLSSDVPSSDALSANPPGKDPDRVKPARPAMPDELRSRYLAEMRPLLISSLGPIADRVIADAVKRSSSAQDVTDMLARHFTENANEQAFRIAAGKLIRQHEVSVPDPEPDRPALEKPPLPVKFLDAAQSLLASFVGPVSGIVIRQSLFDVPNDAELAGRLASHIPAEDERLVFLARLKELMRTHGAGEGEA
jgi:serine/threonine-protein kinase